MPKQKELFPLLCTVEDDNGDICNRVVSRQQLDQDGMCHHCADTISMWWQDNLLEFIHDPKRKQFVEKGRSS